MLNGIICFLAGVWWKSKWCCPALAHAISCVLGGFMLCFWAFFIVVSCNAIWPEASSPGGYFLGYSVPRAAPLWLWLHTPKENVSSFPVGLITSCKMLLNTLQGREPAMSQLEMHSLCPQPVDVYFCSRWALLSCCD